MTEDRYAAKRAAADIATALEARRVDTVEWHTEYAAACHAVVDANDALAEGASSAVGIAMVSARWHQWAINAERRAAELRGEQS